MQNVIPIERSLVKCAYYRAARKNIYELPGLNHSLASSLSSGLSVKDDSDLHGSPVLFLTSVLSLIVLTIQSHLLLYFTWGMTSSVNVLSSTSALNLSSDPNQHLVCTISLKHCSLPGENYRISEANLC